MDNTTKMDFDLTDDTDKIIVGDETLFDEEPTRDMRFDNEGENKDE